MTLRETLFSSVEYEKVFNLFEESDILAYVFFFTLIGEVPIIFKEHILQRRFSSKTRFAILYVVCICNEAPGEI